MNNSTEGYSDDEPVEVSLALELGNIRAVYTLNMRAPLKWNE